MQTTKQKLNKDLCYICQEREHTILDLEDVEYPAKCQICDTIRMIQNGWIQHPKTGNWHKGKLPETVIGEVCTMCRAALHNKCEEQNCGCEDCK